MHKHLNNCFNTKAFSNTRFFYFQRAFKIVIYFLKRGVVTDRYAVAVRFPWKIISFSVERNNYQIQ